METSLKKIPNHGAYAVFSSNTLAALIGYNLDTYEVAVIYTLPEDAIQEVEDFAETVRAQGVPEPAKITTGPERWELYGMPVRDNGRLSLNTITLLWWERIQEDVLRN